MRLVDWEKIDAVIFDLDGTLYRQGPVRLRMTAALLWNSLLHPSAWHDPIIIRDFRKRRETLAGRRIENLEQAQYRICAQGLGLPEDRVRQTVDRWMHREPLALLAAQRRPGCRRLLQALRGRGVATAVVSDYPAEDKLRMLDFQPDLVLCNEDPRIERLKPDPAGFLLAAWLLGAAEGRCLVIGDRDDRDGQAARLAGMDWLILDGKHPDGPHRVGGFEPLLAELAAL